MADTILKLGDFTFADYEIPATINFGGKQNTVIHRLPGGRRVIDVMGRDDDDIAWKGVLTGPEALTRVKQLDTMRIAGDVVPLIWAKFRYQVVISQLEANFERWYQIPYQITVIVLNDNSNGVTVDAIDLDSSLQGDLAKAKGLAAKINDGVITKAMNALDSAIKGVTNIANAAKSVINSILTPIVTIQQRVRALIANASNTLTSITTLGGLLPNNPISKQIQKFNAQTSKYTDLTNLYQLESVMGRMDSALSVASGLGETVNTVKAVGGNLFGIARDVYGDATKWTGLASANNLSDPVISGEKDIKVPASAPDTGGVLGNG